jgi:subtilase family serine protease
LQVQLPADSADLSTLAVEPTFHVAPVLLEEPSDIDAASNDASALLPPHVTSVPPALAHLSTRRLTREAIEAAAYGADSTTDLQADDPRATPLAAGTAVATYSPAQIRAAYAMPPLPAAGTTVSPAAGAQLGAGQTIYIIDAMNDPNVAAELAAFNQTFGLPSCVSSVIAPGASLPLARAAATGCSLSVVYTTSAGAMTASPPGYDSGWSTEISLDVQWSHATAPLARIILIEAPDASLNSLLGAVDLANAMGPGVVSMSFGSPEGNWAAAVDSAFTAANMSYLAATGDAGAAVDWPAVSAHVLAVSATTLTYTGASPRSEIAWSDTGGGISAYVPAPSYQTSAVPGMGVQSHRNSANVAFNGDPTTGQYVAVMSPNSANVGWASAGGTSLSTPQVAGTYSLQISATDTAKLSAKASMAVTITAH